MKKRILVVYFSQTGQLESVVKSFISPFIDDDKIHVDVCPIEPKRSFPFPWSFYQFFDVFPETVKLDGCEIEPIRAEGEYDLVILAYTSWFLSPSMPITGFLKSVQAQQLLKDKPVITLIACRDMWLMAQEKMKVLLKNIGADLIDNVVLTDRGKSIYTFITTPRWMLTGKKNAFWFFPSAGILKSEIYDSCRFGSRLLESLHKDEEKEHKPLLKNLKAVTVSDKFIASEKIATRSFAIWGSLIQKLGKPRSITRKILITIYIGFLLTMIITVVPINILLRKLFKKWRKRALKEAIVYFEQPSGSMD